MEITGFETKNVSGFNKLEFVHAALVRSISYPDDNHAVDVDLNVGASWNELYFTVGTGSLKITQKENDSGVYYQSTLTVVNPKITGEKSIQFINFEQKDLVLVVTTNNGDKILLGTPDEPTRMISEMIVPEISGGRNQRKIKFDTITKEEPYFISLSETATGGGFSDGFSEGFRI